MMLAQQKQEVLSHFFISTYYGNNECTEEKIALGFTYSVLLTLLVTTIQRVHNESVRVYVDHDEMSTTVRVFIEALDISATTQHPMTPEVVTALLHQLLEDTNLKSYVQTKLAKQHDEQAKIAALTLQGQQVTNVGFDFDNSLNMAMSAMDVLRS